jgi:hypothetical protein
VSEVQSKKSVLEKEIKALKHKSSLNSQGNIYRPISTPQMPVHSLSYSIPGIDKFPCHLARHHQFLMSCLQEV